MQIDWGLAVGIAGSIISAAGFGFTVQQLQRTAKATNAVKTAVAQLRNRMAAFDYSSECVRAGKSLEHASRLLRAKQWGDAATTLLEAQSMLHRISESVDGKDGAKLSAAESAEYLLEVISNLEDSDEKDLDYNATELITKLVSKLTHSTRKLLASIGNYTTMPNLRNTQIEILDALIDKHFQGLLTWKAREGEYSYETSVGHFVFHIDRKPLAGKLNFKIWVFDDVGNDLDSFNTTSFDDLIPADSKFDSYTKAIGTVYREVKEKLTLAQIGPALDVLKNLR